MKSSRVFACLTALIAGGLAQHSYAQSSQFQVTVQAIASYVGEDMTPRVVDQRSSSEPAGATAEAFLTIGGTSANARTFARFNYLDASASVEASRPDLNDSMGGFSTAVWQDTLFFDRLGSRVTSGSVQATADIDGRIFLFGEGASATATLNLRAGLSKNEVSFTESGSHRSTIEVIATGDLSAGLPVQLLILVSAGNRLSEPSISDADFRSTARITSVVYLTPEGLPDPSVTVTSASGVVYGVPEPTCGALAVVCLCSAGGRFRRRS